jgi:hypothetical protein
MGLARSNRDSFTATIHPLPAVVAKPVFLTGEAIQNAPTSVFDSGAESLGVGAAGPPIVSMALFLRESRRRQGGDCDDYDQSDGAGHLYASY